MAKQGLFEDKDFKLYFKKNHSTMITLDKVKHPIFYNWIKTHYAQIGRVYTEINKDKKYTADKVWCYFSNDSYAKIQRELGVVGDVTDFGFSSNQTIFAIANNDYYEQDRKRESRYRVNKNILKGFSPKIEV